MKNAWILNSSLPQYTLKIFGIGVRKGVDFGCIYVWLNECDNFFFGTDYTPSTCRIRFYSIKKPHVPTTELINYTTLEEISIFVRNIIFNLSSQFLSTKLMTSTSLCLKKIKKYINILFLPAALKVKTTCGFFHNCRLMSSAAFNWWCKLKASLVIDSYDLCVGFIWRKTFPSRVIRWRQQEELLHTGLLILIFFFFFFIVILVWDLQKTLKIF